MKQVRLVLENSREHLIGFRKSYFEIYKENDKKNNIFCKKKYNNFACGIIGLQNGNVYI